MILNALLLSLILTGTPGPTTAAEVSVQTGQAHFEAGEYSDAIKVLTAALVANPQDASINFWLARSYYEQHKYDEAISHAETAVKQAPNNGEYQRWLGRAYGEKADQTRSFFLARKVKQAFEAAVRLAPRSIEARRDLMQYLVEAPWIVGGDKGKAREQVQVITEMDPVQGRLAQASYLSAQKKWKEAEAEYLVVLDGHPSRIEPIMEAAEFFADRKDVSNLERALIEARRVNARDPRVDFYHAVVLILRRTDLPTAQKLLTAYVANVPERSDYPSHRKAGEWLNPQK
jgi:tetratricopeptide (TPR) repeat protein